jgi:hypothetical protein
MIVMALVTSMLAAGACGDDTEQATGDMFCETIVELDDRAFNGGVGVEIDSSMSESEQQARLDEASAGMRAAIDEAESIFGDLEARAPAEVSADVALVVGDLRNMWTQMRDQPDVLHAIDVTSSFDGGQGVPEAIERIDDFAEQRCGVGFSLAGDMFAPRSDAPESPPPPPPPPPPPAPPPPPPNPYGGG